jgi:hypothetical protein
MHGHPVGQHSAKGGTPQFGLHDAADAGVGAPMVVMSGSAMTIACPSLNANARLEMRGLFMLLNRIDLVASRGTRANNNLLRRNCANASQTIFGSTVSFNSSPRRVAISSTVVRPSQCFQTSAAV